ncbi:MAG: serine hydrolase [Candidatus Izemoplasmatales bacterium]
MKKGFSSAVICFLKTRLSILFLSFFLMLFVSCAETSQTTTFTTSNPNEEIISELDAILDDADDVNIYGISVYKNDSLIAREFYNGASENAKHNVFSVTKSITSLLVGIAIDKGYIENVNQTIDEFIDLSIYQNSELISTITIKQLLTMSAGLIWDSSNLSGEMDELRTNPDPLGLILNREIGYQPGTHFSYSDGAAHLVSIILARVTEMSIHDFAKEYLFSPLEIQDTIWNTDQLLNNIGGCDLYLSHEDLYKIGKLVLGQGEYEGDRIVSQDWISQSTSPQIQVDSVTDYGYYWWITSSSGSALNYALGWGGQMVFIVPNENLIVITTANGFVSDNNAGAQASQLYDIAFDQIIPLMIGSYTN